MKVNSIRRGLVGIVMVLIISMAVTACGPAPEPEMIEVTREVPMEVEVEVTRQVEVEVEKPVEVEVEVVVTQAPAPLPEGGVKTIPLMTTESDPESVAVFQEIIAEFEAENPDVRIDLVLTAHGSEFERLVTANAVGADLGVVGIHPDHLTDYVEAGWLLPLDDVIAAIGEGNWKPGAVLSAGEHSYAIGYAQGTHSTIWVRQDLLDAAGLGLPTTYDELLTAAEALTQDTNGDGEIDVYGIGLPAAANGATQARFIPFVLQNCGSYFDKEGNLTFDHPNVLDGFKKYLALLEYAPPDVTGWSWYDGITAFTAGKIAMHPYGGRLGYNLYRDKPEMRAVTTVIWEPAGDKVKAGRGAYDYMAVSGTARWPEETKDFLEFFFTGDRLARLELTVPGHLIPPTEELEAAVLASDHPYVLEYTDDIKTLFASSPYNVTPQVFMGAVDIETCSLDLVYNPNPWAGSVFDTYIDVQMLERVMSGGETPEEAWQWAIGEMQRASDEWKAEHPDWVPVASQ